MPGIGVAWPAAVVAVAAICVESTAIWVEVAATFVSVIAWVAVAATDVWVERGTAGVTVETETGFPLPPPVMIRFVEDPETSPAALVFTCAGTGVLTKVGVR